MNKISVFLDKLETHFPQSYRFICFLVNKCVSQKEDLFFYPHQNCRNDNYDIFNVESDNVLVLLKHALFDPELKQRKIHIVYYHPEKLEQYQKYCKEVANIDADFVLYEDNYHFLRAFFSSKIIFTDNFYVNFEYKTNQQFSICLGYYAAPFKDDYYKIEDFGEKRQREDRSINASYDYHITSSDLSSRLISLDSLIYFQKFRALGMPRNDVFFKDNRELRSKLLEILGVTAKHIFLYVPTHRDYENVSRKYFDKKMAQKRGLWGNVNDEDEDRLNSMLENNDAIVIAKVHPAQAKIICESNTMNRVFLYSEIVKRLPTNLNALMAVSDYMISDYTTAAYDFLCTDKPLIYYFYDIQKYLGTRGFSFNPIDPYCPGDIVYDIYGLIDAMNGVMNGDDNHASEENI